MLAGHPFDVVPPVLRQPLVHVVAVLLDGAGQSVADIPVSRLRVDFLGEPDQISRFRHVWRHGDVAVDRTFEQIGRNVGEVFGEQRQHAGVGFEVRLASGPVTQPEARNQ